MTFKLLYEIFYFLFAYTDVIAVFQGTRLLSNLRSSIGQTPLAEAYAQERNKLTRHHAQYIRFQIIIISFHSIATLSFYYFIRRSYIFNKAIISFPLTLFLSFVKFDQTKNLFKNYG